MKTETMTPDEINDAIRAQVEREMPTPVGGFETDDQRDALHARHETRFAELVENPALWNFAKAEGGGE